MDKSDDFTEAHDTRMIRKFGSSEAFEKVKKSHGLIPRGAEVGLDASINYTQDQLTKRVQSCTLNSHRLVLFVTQFGLDKSEKLYDELNRRHFLEAGVLNDNSLLVASLKHSGLTDAELALSIEFLQNKNRGTAEVLKLYDQVTSQGIYSIPTLIVDGTYVVNGAARAQEVLEVFIKLKQQGGPRGKRAFPYGNHL
jgi:predicted DsbA family dithiol-disulfide isomerase